MNKQKILWEILAKNNAKYYIASYKGKNITEEEFEASGMRDYQRLIKNDKFIFKKGTVLDLGCGIGRLTKFMLNDFNHVIGVDISAEMIKQGRERLKGVTFIENDGQTLPIPDNCVDFVFSYLVFQHFKTKAMLQNNFKEAYRVLKMGGLFKVLVRSDKVDINAWWGGVDCDEKIALKVGFTLIKKEKVGEHGLWLWLYK